MSSIKFSFSAATDPLAPCRFWMILLALAICDDADRRKRQNKDKKWRSPRDRQQDRAV